MQADAAAEMPGHRPAQVVRGVQHHESILQVSYFLVRAVDLDRVIEQLELVHHARAVICEVLGVVHHQLDPARAAGAQEGVDLGDAPGRIELQRRRVGIENPQLAPRLLEQPVHRQLEFGFAA